MLAAAIASSSLKYPRWPLSRFVTLKPVGDGGRRRRVLVIGTLPEVDRHDDHSTGGERAVVERAGRPVVARPGAAVDVDEGGHRLAGLALRTVDARQQLHALRFREDDVGLF